MVNFNGACTLVNTVKCQSNPLFVHWVKGKYILKKKILSVHKNCEINIFCILAFDMQHEWFILSLMVLLFYSISETMLVGGLSALNICTKLFVNLFSCWVLHHIVENDSSSLLCKIWCIKIYIVYYILTCN